jgi:hypothetical protein
VCLCIKYKKFRKSKELLRVGNFIFLRKKYLQN